jgi:hypothetical protein
MGVYVTGVRRRQKERARLCLAALLRYAVHVTVSTDTQPLALETTFSDAERVGRTQKLGREPKALGDLPRFVRANFLAVPPLHAQEQILENRAFEQHRRLWHVGVRQEGRLVDDALVILGGHDDAREHLHQHVATIIMPVENGVLIFLL